jgi:UDP-N-acetyl-D-mannosaminuronate dehydrogenase
LGASSYKDDDVIIAEPEEDKSPWSTLQYELSSDYFQKSSKTVVQNYNQHTDGAWPEITSPDRPVVAVIGTGYVGYNLVTIFGAHYEVLAFDVSVKRIEEISKLKQPPLVTPTSNPDHLSRATHFLIAVPTQILPSKKIDTACIEKALSTIDYYARPGATVVIESSVAVGMTRQLLEPLMRSRGLKAGMSPEVC